MLILILAVSLSACPSDDDPEPSGAEVEGVMASKSNYRIAGK
ncbi:hypothetical protein [Tunicatimonas pelagia]|nr:hypothetical protein [Tunicatimonas pelagia]WKN42218.1 hypothetical protein P0M28_24580 [Tunicatimonas pelagia]